VLAGGLTRGTAPGSSTAKECCEGGRRNLRPSTGSTRSLPSASPNQDQYQDLNQKKKKQETASLRSAMATVKNKDGNPIDARVLREATEVIREYGRTEDDDMLINTLQNVCLNKHKIELKRAAAVAALLRGRGQHNNEDEQTLHWILDAGISRERSVMTCHCSR